MSIERAAFALLSLFLLCGCSQSAVDPIKIAGRTMGTTYHITVVPETDQLGQASLAPAIDTLLAEINQTMSTYIEDSELSVLNRAPVGTPIKVSSDLFDVLMTSLEISWLSGGAFDISVGPLVNLWGFGPNPSQDKVPAAKQIAELLALTGYQQLELDLVSSEVTKKVALQLDLSAIAKGYAVDRVAQWLERQGLMNYMVEIGGEIKLSGHNPAGTDWRIAIEQPDEMLGGVNRALSLTNAAIATSGDYRNYFEVGGKRYSHTIDPRTGRPIEHQLASVTVITDSTARADALATAINVMGAEQGLALAEKENLAIYVISHNGQGEFTTRYSSAFQAYLQKP